MRVAVLGATGLVGQKFIALLYKHYPWDIAELVASEEKRGLSYHSVCNWQEPLIPMPTCVGHIPIKLIEEVESDVIVSFLPCRVAREYEYYCLSRGKIVFSNSSAYRMHPQVPIIIPEVNLEHMRLVCEQPFPGRMITNSNCCVSGIALALDPLQVFGISNLHIVTLQSVSGAGYPGLSSMDIVANTVPYIPNEEEKIRLETLKILGEVNSPADIPISVSVHRVPVVYGHTLTLHITFTQAVDIRDILECYHVRNERFSSIYQLYDSPWHPQARKDLMDDDMRVHIGPLKYGGDNKTIKMNVLVHNLVRGAAGAVLRNMEFYFSQYFGECSCRQ
ncbi:aspartate-semialdehyde dehydrogenase [Chlamydia ibidis]|uniref:Aspartate-semialdehyde dehydrogenase n=2 Tax=Chlamydia ibidis TaxID=1405396 RepID=S7KK13_9CHLA|nr:aspartate-semialdehyde dehydrogenase [Chlamydia ibidis]EPP34740.1 aspartate-semialdehyde dehydrogenase [Chlamydia ibidis]EQM62378.1 aspartate-semialdehyde dehydrogenase [Chlamydia ibidis 10-1398/6]